MKRILTRMMIAMALIFSWSGAGFAEGSDAAAAVEEDAVTVQEDAAAVQKVITGQVEAFRANDPEAAFSFASPNIQRLMKDDSDRFITMVKSGYPMIFAPVDYSFEELAQAGGRTVQPVIFTGFDLQPVRALYVMQKQKDGTWRIGGVYLATVEDKAT